MPLGFMLYHLRSIATFDVDSPIRFRSLVLLSMLHEPRQVFLKIGGHFLNAIKTPAQFGLADAKQFPHLPQPNPSSAQMTFQGVGPFSWEQYS
jgi:hypothetical protein